MKRKHNPMRQPAACLAMACLLLLTGSACQKHTLYHAYRPTDTNGWHRHDTLSFRPDKPLAANENYSVSLGIRHRDSYKYHDIWLTVNQDTVHLYLTDADGNWNGNGIGDLYQYTHTLPSIACTADSITEVRINHIMQDSPLKGITDIGLQIQR